IAFFVMVMTNFIMNVAAIAISLPVALVIAPYLGVSGEVILFASLVVAGMPFLLLVGAAPNAIAYDSKQFTTGEFFLYGLVASAILMVVTGFAVYVLWPIMGMPILTAGEMARISSALFRRFVIPGLTGNPCGEGEVLFRAQRCLPTRSRSRWASRCRMASRLSYLRLPLARASSSFTLPFLK
ncbi:MAG: hypothetical protein V2L15_05980, partial [Desulfobacteraceae bacterium]|nr:hypothetical protein [Desulfobacteraceae bacterium]